MDKNYGAGETGNGQSYVERVPRGRCTPPIAPIPDSRRAESMKSKKPTVRPGRRESRIIVLPKGQPDPQKPMSEWQRGYAGFERKIGSSIFMPLLFLLSVCGLAVHLVGITGAPEGYFKWSISCEGVVTAAEGNRASGLQEYSIGWIWYEGSGPSTASDGGSLPQSLSGTEIRTYDVLSPRGIAGSSISEYGWLGDVDGTSAAIGLLVSMGHVLGLVIYVIILGIMYYLMFGARFRCNCRVFGAAAKASGGLLAWMIALGTVGFRLAIQYSFTEEIVSTLHEEGFMCQDEGASMSGEYAYISTGFGCVACALTFFLTWRFGRVADDALAERFHRRVSVINPNTGMKS